mgnify:CR=1 FL=1
MRSKTGQKQTDLQGPENPEGLNITFQWFVLNVL